MRHEPYAPGNSERDPLLETLHAWRAKADEDLAILRYLLKSPKGNTEEDVRVFEPGGTRPGFSITALHNRSAAPRAISSGVPVLEELKVATAICISRSRTTPPLVLIGPARGIMETYLRYLRGPSVDPDVMLAAGETAILVGRLAQYLDSWGESHAALSWAITIGRELSNAKLVAHALGAMSGLYSGIPRGGHSGNPAKAIEFLDAAIAASDSSSAPMQAWLYARRAEEYATIGRALAARRDLDDAERYLLAIRQPADGFFSHISDRWLLGYRGNCERLLNKPMAAVHHLEQALSEKLHGQLSASSRSGVLADLAAALAQHGEGDQAASVLIQSLDLAVSSGVSIAVQRIRGIRRRHLGCFADNPLVKQLDERLLGIQP